MCYTLRRVLMCHPSLAGGDTMTSYEKLALALAILQIVIGVLQLWKM